MTKWEALNPMIEAECSCNGMIILERNANSAYFYCARPSCDSYHFVFRCFGSPIDNDFKAEIVERLRKQEAMLERIIIHRKTT